MSFNKSKNRQSAERYLAQGKIRAAITEYVHIVDNDPADYNTLNVLGDLYARVNNKEEAVECFRKLADHYNKQGFSQKAIAIYNKISRLKPDSVEVSAKLAPLYHMKGLVAEARSHYSVLAEYYKSTGKKLEALKIWQQIAELDPNNVEVFFTLAENYLQEDFTNEAIEAFTEAGRRFCGQKNYEKAISAYTKALEVRPGDPAATEGLINCQITVGYYDEAVVLIENSLALNPTNIDLISLLLVCHVELGNYAEAENTVIDLVEKEPSNYRKFLDVVGLHLRNKDTDAASRMLAMCSEHLLVAGSGDELKTWIDEILAQNPEQVTALGLLVRLHAWQREDEELGSALIRMADAAQNSGDVESEKAALSQLLMLSPEEIRFRIRLEELGGGSMPQRFGSSTFENATDIPTFESFESLSDIEEDGNNEEYPEFAAEIDSLTSDTDSGTTDFAFVNPNGNGNGNGYGGSNGFSAPEIESPAQAPSSAELIKSRETHLYQELESVDFYLVEGYDDLASQTLDLLESQFGKHHAIDLRRRQLAEKTGVPYVETPASEAAAVPAASEVFYPEHIAQDPAASELVDDLYQEFVEEVVAEFSEQPAVPEYTAQAYDPVETFGAPPVNDAAETVGDFSDVSIVSESEASETFVPQISDVEIPVHESLQSMLEDEFDEIAPGSNVAGNEHSLFEDMRSELGFEENEAPPEADSDYETHYNLGTAYKEMGLFENAVESFQEAVKLVTPDDDFRRFLHCCHALGYCFMEKKMPKLAQLWYEKALQSKNLTVEEKQALNYEIALAFEAQGKPREAIELYSEIYALDVTYRDVKDKLEALNGNR